MNERREGAVLYPEEKRVRLRHEKPGFVYELRDAGGGAFDVVRLDTVLGVETPVGRISPKGERFVAEKTGKTRPDEALRLGARAWSNLKYLRTQTPPEE